MSEKQSFTGDGTALPSATEFAATFHKIPALIGYGIRCGKPNCKCASGDYRHGTYYALFWRDGCGRLHRRYVRQAEVSEVRAIIELRQGIARERRAAMTESKSRLRELRIWLRDTERLGREQG